MLFRHKEEIHPRNQESVCHLWAIQKAAQVIPTLKNHQIPGSNSAKLIYRNDTKWLSIYTPRKMNKCHLKREHIKRVSRSNHQISGDMCMFRGRIKLYRIVHRKVRFEKRSMYKKCKIHVSFDVSYGCLCTFEKKHFTNKNPIAD